MNPSERIKAALARPEAARVATQTPTLKPPADVESTLPLLGASDASRVSRTPEPAVSRTPATGSVPKAGTEQTSAAERNPRQARRIYVAAAALVLIGVSVVLIRARILSPSQAAPATALQVAVKQEGNGLLSIRWNPQSAPIAKAREGRLIILEANQQPKTVPLQAEDLKIGHVFYESSADRLEFRLEVVDGSGAIVKESVVSAASAAPPAAPAPAQPQPGQSPIQTQPAPAPKTQLAAKAEPQNGRTAAAAPEPVAPPPTVQEEPVSKPAPRAFTPPPVPTRNSVEDSRAVVLDPAGPLPGGITAPARVNLPQFGAAPAPPNSAAQRAPVTSANRQPATGGSVEAAVLVKKVAPVYPAIARSARIQGTVRFTAVVDKSGKVQNLQFVSGPQMLVQAASDAVKKWTYRPMMLNGKPSDVITQIEVKFSLSQ